MVGRGAAKKAAAKVDQLAKAKGVRAPGVVTRKVVRTLAVIIEAGEKTVEETKEAFIALLRKSGSASPQIMGMKENQQKKTLIVVVGDEAERKKVEELAKNELSISRPKGISPEITLNNIPTLLSDADVVEGICTKNGLGEVDPGAVRVTRSFKN